MKISKIVSVGVLALALVGCSSGGSANDSTGTTGTESSSSGGSTGTPSTGSSGSASSSTSTGSSGTSGALAPVITSFTATPATLPAGGGSVVLSWASAGATSLQIDSGVGDVSGQTEVTFAVGQSTLFTLTATNAVGSVTATAQVTVATSGTITGTVQSLEGAPMQGVTAYIAGQPPTQTDAAGHFTLSNITPPYDLTLVTGSVPHAIVTYVGLTSATPTFLAVEDGTAPQTHSVSVAGAVTGIVSTLNPSTTKVYLRNAARQANQDVSVVRSFFATTLSYEGDPVATVTAMAVQSETQGDGGLGYLAFGQTSIALDGGASVSGVTLPLSPVSTATLSGTTNFASDAGVRVGARLELGGESVTFPFSTFAGPAFAVLVPQVPGATFQISGQVSNAGSTGVALVSGVQAGATGAALTFLGGTQIVSPLAGATGVTAQTFLNWAPGVPTGSSPCYAVQLTPVAGTPGAANAPTYLVITRSTQAHLPDLTSLGLSFPTNQSYSMLLLTLDPVARPEDFLSEYVALLVQRGTPPPVMALDIASSRSFTTAP